MKKILIATFALTIGLVIVVMLALDHPAVQNALLTKGMTSAMSTNNDVTKDALHVFVCGSSSPLPSPNRAQACIAIVTPEHFYVIDSGAGSSANILLDRLPLDRLDGVLLTHFHSDHIAELYELNLVSWVAGRPEPLRVHGPAGVQQVVDGINTTYANDVSYRIAHHGAELMPPQLAVLHAQTFTPGIVIDDNGLQIKAITVDHAPIAPAIAFRIEYKGRTVLVTGDTIMTQGIAEAANDIDLMLTDALSMPILEIMAAVADDTGRTRNAQIFRDIVDYHATTENITKVSKQANIGLVAYYHMVPAPSNFIMEKIYRRDIPDNVILTEDGMWFELAVGEEQVVVR